MAPPRKKRKAKTVKKVENDDVNSKEAMLTIQRLTRKYLHKSPNASACDRGVIELPLPSPILDSESNKNVKQKIFSLSHTQRVRPKRLSKPTLMKIPKKVLATSKSGNMSPRVKTLKPRLEHSTPNEVTTTSKTENSLFGFEDMQTPSGLSPDVSEVDGLDSTRSSGSLCKSELELSVKREAKPYNVPNKRRRKKQPGFSESEVKKWVTDMNYQFDEVDNFQLLIE